MLSLANTWVDVYRGVSDDGTGLTLGDLEAEMLPTEQVDPLTTDPVLSHIPMQVIEHSRKVFLEESGELRTIRYGEGRCTGTYDIRKNDRLWDTVKAKWWTVNEIDSGGRTLAGLTDLTLDLRVV